MFGPNALFPTGPGGISGSGGGTSGFQGRDVIWVDLRFPSGGDGTDARPYNTANVGLGAVPDAGTIILVGGDSSTEPGVNIGARNFTVLGIGGHSSGGLAAVLPTLTYAITTGTQRLAFHDVSVALVHSGANSGLSEFYFENCPNVTLTAGSDTSPVYWEGNAKCTFAGTGGAGEFRGGNIDGYVANSGSISITSANVTDSLTSPTAITVLGGCTFGPGVAVTAPSIKIDPASYKNAVDAGVTFSSTAQVLIVYGTPVDIGTANAPGTSQKAAREDHVHDLPFLPVQDALGQATGSISVNNQKITNVATPTSSGDVVNKAYADAIAVGLKLKNPAVAVATANQATMSGTAQTIDGVALNTIGQRVLLTAQTTATQNGLWVVQSGAWTRPTDFATGSSAALAYVPVTGGTVYSGSGWLDTNTVGSDVVDTNNLTWGLFTQPTSFVAGNGIVRTGNTFDVVPHADGSIVVHADDVQIGVLATDAQHGTRGGGTQHAVATTSVAGFMSAADKLKLDGITGDGVERVGFAPCRVATTANITLSGAQTIDGVSCVAGDRVLVKNQTTGSQNGLYVVASGAWSRATDADASAEFVGGKICPISEGTVNGNRVAILTTDDPITLGSTALTFAMDRVVPVTSTAPLDVTKAAASPGSSSEAARADHKHDVSTAIVGNIGTTNAEGSASSVARSDHTHALTFTVVAAVLAVASASISVNNQKITNLAAPTVASDAVNKGYVDALVPTPANPGDNGKVAYANAGAIAYASSVKTDGTYLAIGTNAAASALIRAPNASSILAARNAANNADLLMVSCDSSNGIKFGDSTGVTSLYLQTAFGGVHYIYTGTNVEYSFSSTVADFKDSILQFGTNPSGSGWLRLPGSTQIIIGQRNVLNTQNVALLQSDNADGLVLGDNTYTTSLTYGVKTGGSYKFQVNNVDEYVLDASKFDLKTNTVAHGASPSTNAVFNFSSGDSALLGAKNSGGTDRALLTWTSGTDTLSVGVTTLTTIVNGGGGGWNFGSIASFPGVEHKIASSGFVRFGSNTAGIGLVRVDSNVGHIVSAKNYDGTGDQAILYIGGNTTFTDLYFADAGAKGINSVYYQAKAQHSFVIGANAEFVVNATEVDFKDNAARFGTNPAQSGLIRVPFPASGTYSVIAFRNGLNNADVPLVSLNNLTSSITIGDASSSNTYLTSSLITIDPGGTGSTQPFVFSGGVFDLGINNAINATSTLNFKVGGTSRLQITSSITAFATLNMNSNNITAAQFIEYLNMTAPSAPSLLGWRIYCDSSTGNLMAKPSSGGTLRTLALF